MHWAKKKRSLSPERTVVPAPGPYGAPEGLADTTAWALPVCAAAAPGLVCAAAAAGFLALCLCPFSDTDRDADAVGAGAGEYVANSKAAGSTGTVSVTVPAVANWSTSCTVSPPLSGLVRPSSVSRGDGPPRSTRVFRLRVIGPLPTCTPLAAPGP